MTATTPRSYDFRRSGFIDPALARVLRSWVARAAQLFLKRWEELSPTPVRTRAEAPLTQTFGTLIESLDGFATGGTLTIGSERLVAVVTVHQPGLLALISQILCDPLDRMPEARELTVIEMELASLLFQGVAASLSEAWPQKELLPVQAGAVDSQPQRLRTYTADEFMISAPLVLESSAGPVVLDCAFPRNGLARLLAPLAGGQPANNAASPPVQPLETVLDIPVNVSVTLGTASLGMSELCALNVGDVIVLDQPISAPLLATIDGDRICAGWAGRIGPNQALKITDCY